MGDNILKWSKFQLDFSSKPLVMGILNITPDSFSDGGLFIEPAKALDQAMKMIDAGADIIDVGPASSRPGSQQVDTAEQIKRAVPVIEKITYNSSVPVSIDSPDYSVIKAALDAGASIINDITAASDDDIARLAVEYDVPIILMHMLGCPETMQQRPSYESVVSEVLSFLLDRAGKCQALGLDKDMIIIDPGIGFGKTTEHNIELMANLDKFTASNYRILLGASKKRFLGEITNKPNPADRTVSTLAATAKAFIAGVDIVRVHNVAENVELIKCMKKFTLERYLKN